MDQFDENQRILVAGVAEYIQDIVGQLGQRPNTSTKITPLETTDAAAWIEFRTEFTRALPLMNWNLDTQKQQLLFHCKKQAGQCLGNINLHLNEPNFTIEQLLDSFETKFLSTAATAAAIQEYMSARQRSDMTITAWHSYLHSLHRRAHPQLNADQRNEDQMLCNYFKTGIWDPQLRAAAATCTTNNYADLLPAILQISSTINMMKRTPGGQSINALGAFTAYEEPQQDPMIAQMGRAGPSGFQQQVICHTCERPGHYWRDCPVTRRVFELSKNASPRKSKPQQSSSGYQRGQSGSPARGSPNKGGSFKKSPTKFSPNKGSPNKTGGRVGNDGRVTKVRWNNSRTNQRPSMNAMGDGENQDEEEEEGQCEEDDDSYLNSLSQEEHGEDEGNE